MPSAHVPILKIIYSSTTDESKPNKKIQESKLIVMQVGLNVIPLMRNVSSAQTA
jgi:hypothetical protein